MSTDKKLFTLYQIGTIEVKHRSRMTWLKKRLRALGYTVRVRNLHIKDLDSGLPIQQEENCLIIFQMSVGRRIMAKIQKLYAELTPTQKKNVVLQVPIPEFTLVLPEEMMVHRRYHELRMMLDLEFKLYIFDKA